MNHNTKNNRKKMGFTKKQLLIFGILYLCAIMFSVWYATKGVYFCAYLISGAKAQTTCMGILLSPLIFGIILLIIAKIKSDKKALIVSGIPLTIALLTYAIYYSVGKTTDYYTYGQGLDTFNGKYTGTPGINGCQNALIDNWGNIVIESADYLYRIDNESTDERFYLTINFVDEKNALFKIYKENSDDVTLISTEKYEYTLDRNTAESDPNYEWSDSFIAKKNGSLTMGYKRIHPIWFK